MQGRPWEWGVEKENRERETKGDRDGHKGKRRGRGGKGPHNSTQHKSLNAAVVHTVNPTGTTISFSLVGTVVIILIIIISSSVSSISIVLLISSIIIIIIITTPRILQL